MSEESSAQHPTERRPGWWRTASWPERLALAVLSLCLLTGLAGSRWWPRRDAGTGLVRTVSALELAIDGDADRTAPQDRLLPPLAHTRDGVLRLLGTDELGRSLALRLAGALGTSLLVAGAAALVAVAIGTAWGTAAALLGGRWDGLLMRFAESTAGVPGVVVVMVL